MALIERFTPGGNLYPDGSSTFAVLVQFFKRWAENRDTRDAAMTAAWEADDQDTLTAAQSYADSRATTAETSAVNTANTHANIAASAAEARAVGTANTYTDAATGAAEARAVSTAGDYTDEQVGLVQAGVVTDAGIDSGIDRALTDGRIDTSVNDTALEGVVNDPTSAARGALDTQYADQYSRASILYVDPVNGVDSNTGASWKKAKRTIQAAVDAAPRGGEVILAPGRHQVGAGVNIPDNSKCLTIRGASPVSSRQHAASSWGLAHISSELTGDSRPTALIRVGSETSSNIYGWTFANMYVDADTIAPDGAFLELHGVNRCIFKDLGGRVLGGAENMTRWMVRSDGGAGDDASWFSFRNVTTYGVKLWHSRQGNYSTFSSVSVMGHTGTPRGAGPALDLDGSSHNLNGLHIEGWNTGVKLTGCRGVLGHGIMSEWVGVLVHMVGCRDSIISVNSSAGAGLSEVVDENGIGNTVIGVGHRKVGTTAGAISIGNRGMGPEQMAAGSAGLYYSAHPVLNDPGDMLLPGAQDLAASGVITAEFFDGTTWQPWNVETGYLSVPNLQAITVDAAHSRCRFRTASLLDMGTGLGFVRTTHGSGNATYTFRMYGPDGGVLAEHPVTTEIPGQTRGAFCSFRAGGSARHMEVEIDFRLTGSATATVRRMHLYATEAHSQTRGKSSKGPKGPLGLIEGIGGDTYHCVGTTGSDPNIGMWVYASGTLAGTSGWRKLAYA